MNAAKRDSSRRMNIFAIVNEYRVKSIPENEHGDVT
jgi:hypothetical protein